MKKPQIVKRQHYVWREYLRSWAIKDKIWCYLNGKILNTNLVNVAQEKYFYKLNRLNSNEVEFINNFLLSSIKNKALLKLNIGWVEIFNYVYKLEYLLQAQVINELLIANAINDLEKVVGEYYQTQIEKSGIKYLSLLKEKKIDFFEDDSSRMEFCFFICVQYFRTKNTQQRFVQSLTQKKIKDIDFSRVWNVARNIFSTNVAQSICFDRQYKIVLLCNQTRIPFITSDQPVVNTHSVVKNKGLVSELEFYYPITPYVSILITKNHKDYGRVKCIKTADGVHACNEYILGFCHDQIYSSERESLEFYYNEGSMFS